MEFHLPMELFLWKIFSKGKGNMGGGVITQPASEAPWGGNSNPLGHAFLSAVYIKYKENETLIK